MATEQTEGIGDLFIVSEQQHQIRCHGLFFILGGGFLLYLDVVGWLVRLDSYICP